MKSAVKLPLYLGLAVLVFSVLVSAVKIGNNQAFTSQKTRANISDARLILKYTSPHTVSVLLTSDKSISGADISLRFNGDKIEVLPSTLTSGPDFVASGGNVDAQGNLFTFSVVTKSPDVSAGIVGSFDVSSISGETVEADLQFDQSTVVIDKALGQNILRETQGVKFTVSQK